MYIQIQSILFWIWAPPQKYEAQERRLPPCRRELRAAAKCLRGSMSMTNFLLVLLSLNLVFQLDCPQFLLWIYIKTFVNEEKRNNLMLILANATPSIRRKRKPRPRTWHAKIWVLLYCSYLTCLKNCNWHFPSKSKVYNWTATHLQLDRFNSLAPVKFGGKKLSPEGCEPTNSLDICDIFAILTNFL